MVATRQRLNPATTDEREKKPAYESMSIKTGSRRETRETTAGTQLSIKIYFHSILLFFFNVLFCSIKVHQRAMARGGVGVA
jgi:hypothetical protein